MVSPPPQGPAYQSDFLQAFGTPAASQQGTNGPGHFDYPSQGAAFYNPTAAEAATPGFVNPWPGPGQPMQLGAPSAAPQAPPSIFAALLKRFGGR